MSTKTSPVSKKVLALLMMAGALSLSACSDNSDSGSEQQAEQSSSEKMTNTMDVKQPEPKSEPKLPLAEEAEPKVAEETPEITPAEKGTAVTAPAEEAAPAPEKTAAVSGEAVYATCVGCHGAQGEGGVGPKLAGQEVDAVVDKLQRYKAGEQVGPMTGMMAPMASGLSDADMQAVAEYVNKL